MLELTRNLLKDALESISKEPHRWSQQDWIKMPDKKWCKLSTQDELREITEPSCGTTLCLAGWMGHHLLKSDLAEKFRTELEQLDVGGAVEQVLANQGESEGVLVALVGVFHSYDLGHPDALRNYLNLALAEQGEAL